MLVASHLFLPSLKIHYSISPPRLAANGTKEKTIKGMKPIAIEVPFRITQWHGGSLPPTGSSFFWDKEGGDNEISDFFFLSEICF